MHLRSPIEVPEVRRRYWLHALLFLLTVISTLIVGAELQNSFAANGPPFSSAETFFQLGWLLSQPSRLLLGVPFSLSLMLILLAHEMGHYIAARHYRVDASLPYFLPAPTLIGTFGAFIRIRSPIHSRHALFDIGIAGPIAGFVFAVGALMFGLRLSRIAPALVESADLQLGYPLVFHAFKGFVPGSPAGMQSVYLHPIAIAAWVGMFATALNLLPGGQLDGGHILFALWPAAHKKISRLLIVTLMVMGFAFWPGWLLWGAILMAFGRRHPRVPQFPALDRKRQWIGAGALLIFLVTFTPSPILGLEILPKMLEFLGRWL
ncbi:MAG TPA: site-2 protease family protein [Terriglobales bacterium]|nr:site-2 protease family protein [Terriglobales bacterium]